MVYEPRRDCRAVLARIEQHIADSEVDGSRGLQCPRVIAIGKQTSASRQCAIDGSGQPYREALHAPRQRAAVASFGDQMEMIALNGEVHEPKAEALTARRQRRPYRVEQPSIAQRRHAGGNSQGDVQRVVARQCGTAQVRDAGGTSLRWAPRSLAFATPGTKGERELWVASHEDGLAQKLLQNEDRVSVARGSELDTWVTDPLVPLCQRSCRVIGDPHGARTMKDDQAILGGL